MPYPLITLKTDLKSLKYGHDRPGGGNSNEPYIQNNINNPKDILGFDDGTIRGGAVGAAKASATDAVRIGKWLTNLPKGPLWLTKQIGLQLSNPKLETRAGFGGLFGEPTRIYNLGINTLAQVPAGAFGIHFNRHGLLPIQSENTKYLAVAQSNDAKDTFGVNNRLVKLKDELIGSGGIPKSSFLTKLLNKVGSFLNLKLPNQTVYDYGGGPGSIYGVGRTRIGRYIDTTKGEINFDPIPIPSDWIKGKPDINKYYTYGFSKYFVPQLQISDPFENANGEPETISTLKSPIPGYNEPSNTQDTVFAWRPELAALGTKGITLPAVVVGTNKFVRYQAYYDLIKSKNLRDTIYPDNANTFGIYSKDNEIVGKNKVPDAPVSNKNIVYHNGSSSLDLGQSWNTFNRESYFKSGRTDGINKQTFVDSNNVIHDLITFKIDPLVPNKTMQFRSYITQFSDGVDAKWNSTQYVGRGEEFYIYNGHTRKIQIGFKVALLSLEEMQPTYLKLSYLMSNLMPQYVYGLMRGPIVKITVGDWINNQFGILNSLNYTIPAESSWEIAMRPNKDERELPHVIDVSLGFTPIGVKNDVAQKGSQQIIGQY